MKIYTHTGEPMEILYVRLEEEKGKISGKKGVKVETPFTTRLEAVNVRRRKEQ